LGSAVVLASRRQASGAGVRSGEVHRLGQLHEGNIVVELFGAVVSLVDVDFGDGVVFFGSILRLQVPFTDADRVGSGVFGLSEAMGGAEDVLVSDECSAADVSVSAEAEGDLPGEFAVTGVDAVDDATSAALLAALLEGRGGGNQQQDQTKSRLHSDF